MLQRLFAVLFDRKLQCSYEEKLEVLETVKKIYKMSCFSQREGILALDEFAAEQEDIFFKSCLFLAAEGVSSKELEEYASIRILEDNTGGKRLLEMAVIADGVVQIRQGERPKTIFRRLGAWFGSEFAKEFQLDLYRLESFPGRPSMLFGNRLLDSKLQCSYEEKLEVLETVSKILEACHLARREGILALDEFAAKQEDMFFKNCLLLVVEAVSREALEEYALIWMQADNTKGKRLLEMAVIADGVGQIQRGENPDMISRRLGAWFGSELAEKFESDLKEMQQQSIIKRRESRREGLLQSEHSFFQPFDAIVEYTPEKILRMIMQVERRTLAMALLGASGQVYRAVMNSISQTEQEALEQEWDDIVYPRYCDVEAAQNAVLGWEKR